MTNPLADIEAQHGFVFGNPDADTGNAAKPYATLVCTAPQCAHRGQHVQIHEDTVLPLHCGGCQTVLHCDHEHETTVVRAGTIGKPIEHTITACRICKTETARDTVELPPISLADLPLSILDQPVS